MTVSQLINKYYDHNPDGHFFDRETLKFFGERRSDMYVYKETIKITTYSGEVHECYMLRTIQRGIPFNPPKRKYHFFDVNTFKEIINPELEDRCK